MNEEQKNLSDKRDSLIDLADIFAPDWARQSADDAPHHVVNYADTDRGRERARDSRRDGRPRTPARRRFDGAEGGGGHDRPRRKAAPRPPRRDDSGGEGHSLRPRPPRREGGSRAPRRPIEREAPLDLNVRFLPEQKALNAIIKRIQTTHRAYPFKDIVKLFLNSDDSLQVRLEIPKELKESQEIYQCNLCRLPARNEEDLKAHLLQHHLGDFFVIEEIEAEPASGNFTCVAKCGLSGELLGPPNHHSYGYRVAEMLRTRYQHMSEEEYRSRIEMVHDSEAVEAWRETTRHKLLYRLKSEMPAEEPAPPKENQEVETPEPLEDSAPDAEITPDAETTPDVEDAPVAEGKLPKSMEQVEAESYFNREIVPKQIVKGGRITAPATILKGHPDRRLAHHLVAALNFEARRKGSLHHALQGAFQRRGLHIFRADNERGPQFVVAAKPTPMTTTHAVARLREIIAFVSQNPSCSYQELVAGILPEAQDEHAKAELATQVEWLSERGHLISYYNGMLSVAAEHPAYHPHGRKKRPTPPPPAQPAPEAPAEEASVPSAPEAPAEKVPSTPPAPEAPAEEVPSTPPAPEAPAEEVPTTPPAPEAPAEEEAPTSPAPEALAEEAPAAAKTIEEMFEEKESEDDDW